MQKFFTPLYTRNHRRFYLTSAGLIFAALLIITVIAYARNNGYTGVTSSTSFGCNCHALNASSATTVTVSAQSGSFTVQPGSTNTFTVAVTNSAKQTAGVDIAVKTTQTGNTDAGTLSPESGSGLYNSGGELTHSQPKAMSGGSASFTFTWTAPTTPGTYYMRAVGNATNNNGQDDSGDIWNWMSVQAITVQSAPTVTVTAPNGGETWCTGTSHNITWTSSAIQNVMIELSNDGGTTWTALASSVQASLGTWSWAIPSGQSAGNQYLIRVSDASNSSTNDVSNGNFAIPGTINIYNQPHNLTGCQGQQASFQVFATGSGISYQWRLNGNNISGATGQTYTINPVTLASAGTYDAVLTGPCGDIQTSASATLTVEVPPTINTQPVTQEACLGDTAIFTIDAIGTNITYQWRKNGQPLNGQNYNKLILYNVNANDAGNYDVVITGTCSPSATSSQAALKINTQPAITAQPQNTTLCIGGSTQVKVGASGSNLQFQWRKNGGNIPNANDSIYTITGATADDAGNYDVIVRGACGNAITSQSFSVSIAMPAAIAQQPQGQTTTPGSNVDLTVKADGTDLSYQWRKDAAPLIGMTQATLSLKNVTLADAGSYDVLISNKCGSVTSQAAVINVVNPGGGPILSLLATSVDFGLIAANTNKDTVLTGIIKNIGDSKLTISTAAITGTDASAFSLLDDISNTSIEKNGSVQLRIRFSPTSRGNKTAKIDFTSNSQINPSIILSGTGGVVEVSALQSELDYGEVKVTEQKDLSFGLQNTGNMNTTITNLSINGAQAGDFQVITPITPASLDAGSTALVTVRYTPVNVGQSDAALSISMDAVTTPLTVRLRGNALSSVFDTPESASLKLQAFPNPANEKLTLSFEPDNSGVYEISISDVLGNSVKKFNINTDSKYEFLWDGTDDSGNALPSGMYVVILKSSKGYASVPVSLTK